MHKRHCSYTGRLVLIAVVTLLLVEGLLSVVLLNRRRAAPELPLNMSWGSAVYDPAIDPDYRSVFQRADQAMYAVKEAHYVAQGRERRL